MNQRKARAIRKLSKFDKKKPTDWRVMKSYDVMVFDKKVNDYRKVKRQTILNASKYAYRKAKKQLQNVNLPKELTR